MKRFFFLTPRREGAGIAAETTGQQRRAINHRDALVLAAALVIGFPMTYASTPDANTDATGVPFAAYLDAVERFNNAIAAQREAVASARAGVPMAGLRPDPSLSLGVGPAELSREVRPKPRLAQSIGLSYTIETGDKRERRVAAARSQVSACCS